ncbi:MAG: substrate-binding domain-containing protein [Anaerolineae bacterium]
MSETDRSKRPTIGVLAGWQFSWTQTPLSYLDPIFRGMCLAAHDLGCNILLGCGMGSWTHQNETLRPAWPQVAPDSDFVPIGPWNTDGFIIVNPLHAPERSRYVQDLMAAGHPVIFVGAGERGPSVRVDNRAGILEAMRHLIEHGHRRIAFIAGSREDLDGDSGDRLRAFREAVAAHHLPADARLIAWGRHVYEGGYAAMRRILDAGVSFSAVLASNDESAMGAMEALKERGYRIPQDVAIIGFDDRPESAVQEPALSSVRVPLFWMGRQAVTSIFRYLKGEATSIESFRLPVHLVTRESCGCDPHALSSTAALELSEGDRLQSEVVQAVVAPLFAGMQTRSIDEIERWWQQLLTAFEVSIKTGEETPFLEALETMLQQMIASGEDVHVWRSVLPGLREAFNELASSELPSASVERLLDEAEARISAQAQCQYRQCVVNQRWMLNRLGTLTARLLAALDEEQVYEVLTQHLPAMDVRTMWIAQFVPQGDDPVAETTLQAITSPEQPQLRFPSRDFPPAELLPAERSFSLALFPLTGPRGQLGFVTFDTNQLDLYGVITQELATALNSVYLYEEAVEGRRLAEEANQMKSRFLSTVSHELRTPLSLIVGLSSILLAENEESPQPLPERYRRDVEQIHINAQLLGGLIGDVLDLASSDAGRLRLANDFVDLSDALRLVAETGQQLAQQKGLRWQVDLPESGPYVWGDRTRLRQVALNLIKNAIKFTTEGGVRLHLDVDTEAESVTVSVSDTGLGIPPEEQALIFDEFHRSERSIVQGYRGIGLGLAICKRLVEMHGGTIGVRSSGEEGVGSTFYFTLPIVRPSDVEMQRPARPAFTEETILILTNRVGRDERLLNHLTERGFTVRSLYMDETPDWLSQVVISPPGAIIVDVNATAQQGWGVLKSLKAHPKTRELPVLFYALSPRGGSVLEFDYLTKPVEMAELTRALDQHWLAPDIDPHGKTILVVDDDLSTLEMHARIVQAHASSPRVLKAQDGMEALKILRQTSVDLVLLDLIMPKLDGFGVLEAMRQEQTLRDIPVIVLTGQVLTEREMGRLSRGVATVLSKGVFSREETLKHIEAALERNRALSGEAQRLVRQAMVYIHEHYAEPISRADLAEHVALSEDYLTDCFRKELGVTPITYINRYRIHQAKILLTETYKSITEIALDVGFSDSSYFSRVFRRETGMSPTDYRQR